MSADSGEERLLRLSAHVDIAVAAQAVTEDSLHDTLAIALSQLYGLIGGAIVFFVEKRPASAPEFDILVDRRDAAKLQAAAAFVTEHQGSPARLQLRPQTHPAKQ